MNLRVRPEARHDLRLAIGWYDERESGLGAVFLAEVDALFQQIAAHPDRHAKVHGSFRRALMRRFPYAVYFVAENGYVIIFAVLHQKQDRGVLGERG